MVALAFYVSKFQKIVDHFASMITSGQLKPGEKLPSTRQIEREFGVSYGSVRGAMLVLKTRGLVIGKQGDGVYVTTDPSEPSP